MKFKVVSNIQQPNLEIYSFEVEDMEDYRKRLEDLIDNEFEWLATELSRYQVVDETSGSSNEIVDQILKNRYKRMVKLDQLAEERDQILTHVEKVTKAFEADQTFAEALLEVLNMNEKFKKMMAEFGTPDNQVQTLILDTETHQISHLKNANDVNQFIESLVDRMNERSKEVTDEIKRDFDKLVESKHQVTYDYRPIIRPLYDATNTTFFETYVEGMRTYRVDDVQLLEIGHLGLFNRLIDNHMSNLPPEYEAPEKEVLSFKRSIEESRQTFDTIEKTMTERPLFLRLIDDSKVDDKLYEKLDDDQMEQLRQFVKYCAERHFIMSKLEDIIVKYDNAKKG